MKEGRCMQCGCLFMEWRPGNHYCPECRTDNESGVLSYYKELWEKRREQK